MRRCARARAPRPIPTPRTSRACGGCAAMNTCSGPSPGVPAPLKPQYIDLLKKRIREKNAGTPETDTSTACFPHGMPRLMESPYPIEIVQTPGRVTFLHEVAHEVRRIYLDQKHPANLHDTFLGHSVGHWEGDTLVVDTVGINDKQLHRRRGRGPLQPGAPDRALPQDRRRAPDRADHDGGRPGHARAPLQLHAATTSGVRTCARRNTSARKTTGTRR